MRTRTIMVAVALLILIPAAAAYAAGSQEGTIPEDRMVITVRPFTMRGTTLAPDSPTELWIEDYFDVELEPWYGIGGYDTEAINVRLSSGDIPDWLGGLSPDYVDLGIVKELPQDLIREHMPGYMKWADHYLGDEVWRRTVIDGVNYGVPTALSMASTGMVMGFRADWLRAVGFEPEKVEGTSFFRGPDTLEEIEEVLLAFREQDPDGDGQQNSYGYMPWKDGPELTTSMLPNVFGAYGVQLFVWDVKNGEPYYSMVDPNYRDALRYINTWWEQGIIHPDFVTAERPDILQAMSNGEFGAWSHLDAWQANTAGGPWGAYREVNPEGGIAYSITPAGPNGNRGTWYRDPNWTPWCIGITASDEKTVKIMQMIEEMFTDADIYARIFYGGPEGETWEWNEDGYAVPIEGKAAKDAAESTELGVRLIIGHVPHIVPPIDKVYIDPRRHALQAFLEDNQTFGPGYGFRPVWNDEERALLANIRTIEQEFGLQAITGQIDVDAEWDSYVESMMDAGLEQLLATVAEQGE